ncbi:hypothetical protein D9M68_877710 [compost metagenome]
MKGYWIILGSDILDAESQQEYGRLWVSIGEKYGATLKVLGEDALKESLHSSRVIAVEFASYADAKACYEDPAYVKAKEFAVRASRRELIIIEGEIV